MEQGVFSLESPKIPHTIPKGECKLLSVCTPQSEYSPEGRTGRAQKRGRTRGHPPAETYVLQTKKPRPQERRDWTDARPPAQNDFHCPHQERLLPVQSWSEEELLRGCLFCPCAHFGAKLGGEKLPYATARQGGELTMTSS